MKKLGRIEKNVSETQATPTPWSTNIIPNQMTRDQLLEGMRWLCNNLYHPAVFAERVSLFVNNFRAARPFKSDKRSQARSLIRPVDVDVLRLIARLAKLGPEKTKALILL
jgi:hypothetical protein